MEFNCSFSLFTEGKNYQFDIVSKSKNSLSGYRVVPRDEADLATIQKFFKDAQVDESLSIDGLVDRLKVLPNISQVDVKVANLFSRHIQLQPHSDRTADVSQFLKSLPQTADGAIDLTKLKKIDQGGTHDVFVLQDTSSSVFVVKVNRKTLKMNDNERLEKFTADTAAYKALHDSFGDHCTLEQLFLKTVADDIETKEAIISVADFEVGFQKESKLDLQETGFNASDVTVARNLGDYDDMLKSLFFS